MQAPEQVAVFFDGSNLYRAAKRACGNGKVNILKLRDFLAAGREIRHCEYWTAALKQEVDALRYSRQRSFLAWLEKHGIKVNLRDMVWQGRWVEKGIDVGLAMSILRFELKLREERKAHEERLAMLEMAERAPEPMREFIRRSLDMPPPPPRVTFILVSGDGDFAQLVESLRELGYDVEVAGVKRHISNALREGATRVLALTKDDRQAFLV